MSKAARELANSPVLRPLLEGLVDMLGMRGTREVLQQAAPPRSPIQDVMNQERGLRMGVRELPELPRRAPQPEFVDGARAVSEPPSSQVPLQRGPIRMEPGYTRGNAGGAQLQPGAIEPRAAEGFEVEAQLRIPFTQPGKGGQMYSPAKSSESADVVEAMLRRNLGDFIDAPEVPRYRGAEGQRAMDLDPEGTRRMMGQMNPAPSTAPNIPDPMRPMGVQMTDLSQIDPRITGAVGAGSLAIGLDRIFRDAENKRVAEPASDEATSSLNSQESAQLNELISTVVADASQQGGIYGQLVLQNAPRDPSTYGSIAEYEAARDQFVNDVTSGAFAQAASLYEQQQREAAAPQSQQTGESIVTERLTSELGSDDMANAVGAGEAEAERMMAPAAMGGTLEEATMAQGAADMRDAATPRPQPELRIASSAMMESLQDQIAARIAQDSEAAMRAGMSPMAQRIRFEGDIRDRDIEARASYDPRFDRR